MEHLIVGPLHESRIDSCHRFDALSGQACGEGHRMLLGDAHVKEAFRKSLGKVVSARAFRHGRGNGHDGFIFSGKLNQCLAEDFRIGGRRPGFGDLVASSDVEGAGAMKLVWVNLRRLVALALGGDDVDQHGTCFFFGRRQHWQKGFDVVAVHRPQVFEAQIFKHGFRHHSVFQPAFHPVDELQHLIPVGQASQPAFYVAFQLVVGLPGPQLVQILGHGSHVFGDGHVVVVEDDDEPSLGVAYVVESFKGHATGHGAVADDSHHMVVFTFKIPGRGDAVCRRDRG